MTPSDVPIAQPNEVDSIRSRVREFLSATFFLPDHEVLADDASLIDTGIVDSTGVLEVIQFLEATFGLHVEDDEIVPSNLDSIDHLVRYVSRKVR